MIFLDFRRQSSGISHHMQTNQQPTDEPLKQFIYILWLTHHFISFFQKADKRKLALEAKQSYSKEKKERIRFRSLFRRFWRRRMMRNTIMVESTIWSIPWRWETFHKEINSLDQMYKDYIETDKGQNKKSARKLAGFSLWPKPSNSNVCEN